MIVLKTNSRHIKFSVGIAILLIIAYLGDELDGMTTNTVIQAMIRGLRGVIHISLLINWCVSLKQRIMNAQVRRSLVAVSILMIFWLTAKVIKYEFIADRTFWLGRYIWYSYYIPMILIPLLGVFIIDHMGKPEGYRNPRWMNALYTATHLKKRFPHLKIGGPAMSWIYNSSWPRNWLDGFLENLTAGRRRLPLDFFSFHIYSNSVEPFVRDAQIIRQKLDDIGYTETEIHINEWNYLENFTSRFIATIEHIISMRGAAFSAAVMLHCQNSPLDMLMYYDARPSAFNGMFDFYTYRTLKGYYPFLMFSKLYELGNTVLAESDSPDVYVLGAVSNIKNRSCYPITHLLIMLPRKTYACIWIRQNPGISFCWIKTIQWKMFLL